MEAVEIFKPIGLISISALWVAIVIMVTRWRGDKSMSISKHSAAHKSAYLMMMGVGFLVFPGYVLFVAKWMTPTFDLPSVFTTITIIAFTGFFLAGCVPDTTGWKARFHSYTSYGASLLLIPSLTILYLSPSISDISRYIVLFTFVYQLVAFTSFAASGKSKSNHLYFQALYFLLYDVAILSVAYIR